jgi:hypothetical protein
MHPKRGLQFLHARILDDAGNLALCIVTAIRDGVVYYKVGDERKAKEYVTLDRWPMIARPTYIEHSSFAKEQWDKLV